MEEMDSYQQLLEHLLFMLVVVAQVTVK